LLKDKTTQKVLANVRNGISLQYTEVSEGCMPTHKWRWYVFKNTEGEAVDTLHLHRQSYYLIGRDERVCDIICRHPSISKQHGVLQYRMVDELVSKNNTDKDSIEGNYQDVTRKVRKPYLMDLNSSHGTYINGMKLEGMRFYELLNKDIVKLGLSSRTYVMINEDTVRKKSKKQLDEDEKNIAEEEKNTDKYVVWSDDDNA